MKVCNEHNVKELYSWSFKNFVEYEKIILFQHTFIKRCLYVMQGRMLWTQKKQNISEKIPSTKI